MLQGKRRVANEKETNRKKNITKPLNKIGKAPKTLNSLAACSLVDVKYWAGSSAWYERLIRNQGKP